MSDIEYINGADLSDANALGFNLAWACKKHAVKAVASYSPVTNKTKYIYVDKDGVICEFGFELKGNPQNLGPDKPKEYPLGSGGSNSAIAAPAPSANITGFELTYNGVTAIKVSNLSPMTAASFLNSVIFKLGTQPTFENVIALLDDNTVVKVAANAGPTEIEVGAGNDTVTGGSDNDLVHKWKAGNLNFDGKGGTDTLDFQAVLGAIFPTAVVQQLVANLDGTAGKNPYGGTLTLKNVENIVGMTGIDKITGNDKANVIGDRHIDLIGLDVVDGKGGDDTVYVDAQKLGTAMGGSGFDNLVVMQAASIDLQDTAFTSHVSGFEKITVGFYDAANTAALRGNAQKNWLVGNFNIDVLEGRGGNDTLDGGIETAAADVAVYSGNRASYTVKAVGATVTVTDKRGAAPDGIDTLYNMETLRFANGDVALQTILPKLGNVVFFDDPSRTSSTDNNDSLYGTSASDSLSGRGGKDLLVGGKGNDTYEGVEAGDILVERAGGGNDTITTALLNFSLAEHTHIENLTGVSSGIAPTGYTLTGNAAANVLRGNFKKDTLNGAAGNDTLQGGFDADNLNGGAGRDTADYSDKVFAVTATLKGASASTVIVNFFNEKDTIRNIENLAGGAKADTFTGDGLANKLWGNAGADKLKGMAGSDTLTGGLGADKLDGGASADKYAYTSTKEGGDNIQSWTSGDKITFTKSAFANLKLGKITTDQFHKVTSGHAAGDAEDRFIFNSKDDTLWFDKDGTGTSKAVLIADFTVSGHDVVISDILIL